ncbi:MAG: acyl-CoA dehydrogenase [Candidatus Omnitrophica bacterium CG12_big_fil_rev_8_21_14_0_65_43_15]|uniref:Cyclohex-1-ene-1-carbonyl-CoA dehydrogenase n=1 Tax=Candidatus Taenaricola geysiri TaxID=1974752 RepID=A0A2J0LI35_9BACT|nr:MAG: acyl-CoA dehydrogenase [Candidatus Omnitrophica bacterium CG1_02_43_210]PIR65598.1 MAG: acyl-CoA dehydrogenase [Candidatus Omnitrophica bacterium CG10_big_fil_rev_8_21_14_0_10_43_8]PIV11793.1 MAG: acyl-CoA dehydrogenase [Candidatus Omnitrophica bacterium CG03_land_8_20_14_0_80_43_22]PIW66859.1 MAG: acyl-CoA dehydrogenase [Candidatus Omnitrophica bacterium CG12_big_fil_rev_8_21_14_0_65_43_15]PIW80486.1 MAG: acyl-CoA dehydrogenase [Candidatus Omnitrophica bacterium CG_4_8_14_3_um_filter_4
MDYLFTENQKMIQELARQIATEKIAPVAAHYDETEEFPWPIMKILSESDLFGVYIEEKYGGTGGGAVDLAIVTEELSKACGGIAVCYAASALGTYPIILYGNEEQKKKYLPDLAAGKKIAAFGLTEAGAGSDAGAIATTAKKDGDYYILNGTKQWITNGGEAQIYTVVAITDKSKGPRGASAFIVEKGTPGFTFGKKEKKLGIRASTTNELIFTDCKVHKDNLLSREGSGFIVAMKTFDQSRPGVAAQAVGIAQGALDHAVKYAKERVQFGKPISSFQAIQHMLADMATQTEAARALVYATARLVDSGAAKISKASAMSKLFASDVAMKVTTDAIQIFGGYGYMRDYPVEKYMRDAKITQIYEGTNQIQRNVIALELIKESLSK